MSKPVLIINPITGLQSYTKHPEKLLERRRIRQERAILIGIERDQSSNPIFWNGSSGGRRMHRPGEVRS